MSEESPDKSTESEQSEEGLKLIPSVEYFLFNTPLYSTHSLNYEQIRVLYGRVFSNGRYVKSKIDGYCSYCKRDSTFEVNAISIPGGDPWDNVRTRYAFDSLSISCVRDEAHLVRYNLLVDNMTITKIGQYPSLADIAINETREKYRNVLRGENWGELYKAIGLAAHGEGIGSFVYLRRVFERLIQTRFNEFKEQEKWDDAAFKVLRIDEKIELLKKHLPTSLVETRKIYKIFSAGIHELDNVTCLKFFEVGKRSIVMILEDDLKKRQELSDRKQLSEAVAKFGTSSQEE